MKSALRCSILLTLAALVVSCGLLASPDNDSECTVDCLEGSSCSTGGKDCIGASHSVTNIDTATGEGLETFKQNDEVYYFSLTQSGGVVSGKSGIDRKPSKFVKLGEIANPEEPILSTAAQDNYVASAWRKSDEILQVAIHEQNTPIQQWFGGEPLQISTPNSTSYFDIALDSENHLDIIYFRPNAGDAIHQRAKVTQRAEGFEIIERELNEILLSECPNPPSTDFHIGLKPDLKTFEETPRALVSCNPVNLLRYRQQGDLTAEQIDFTRKEPGTFANFVGTSGDAIAFTFRAQSSGAIRYGKFNPANRTVDVETIDDGTRLDTKARAKKNLVGYFLSGDITKSQIIVSYTNATSLHPVIATKNWSNSENRETSSWQINPVTSVEGPVGSFNQLHVSSDNHWYLATQQLGQKSDSQIQLLSSGGPSQ